MQSSSGCDSIVNLNLTVSQSSAGTDVLSAVCDSHLWNSILYTSSANYFQTLTNSAGCDSVVTLDLTVNYEDTGTDVLSSCDSLNWIDGITYTSTFKVVRILIQLLTLRAVIVL